MVFFSWLRQELVQNSVLALRRFPVTLVYAFFAVIFMVYAVETDSRDTGIYRFILTTLLGIPLSFSIAIYAERHELNSVWRFLCHAIATGLLLTYFLLFLPEHPVYSAAIRFALVALLVHVWVAFAAHPRDSSILAFWQFNRSLFLRFAVASLFAGVLYIGLSIALVSFDTLLGIKINPKRYSELFFVCAGIIHPWFFLAGVPQNLEQETEVYPPVLRIFAQYILIPLVAIYVFILYLYSIKVIVNWEWPRYKATYLVGLFSAPGILATLLLYPLSVSAWVKRYTRIFHMLLIPLVLMMLLCVYRRVTEHGLTEMMVIAVVMGIWLLFISAFMLKTGGNNIRAVPVSLMVFLLVSSFGPFSAVSLGRTSQTARLTGLLLQEKIPDGKIDLAEKKKIKLTAAAFAEISNKSRYLTDHYGAEALVPFVRGDGSALIFARSENSAPHRRTGHEAYNMFISHFLNTEPDKNKTVSYRTYTLKPELISVKGFSGLIRQQGYRSEEPRSYKGDNYAITIDWKKHLIEISARGDSGIFDFGRLYGDLRQAYTNSETEVKRSIMVRNFMFGEQKAKIHFLRIAGEDEVRDIDFIILLP